MEHGYKRRFVLSIYEEVERKLRDRAQNNSSMSVNQRNVERKTIYMPVLPNLSKCGFVKKLVENHGKKIASRRLPTIYNSLRNIKQPLEEIEKSGVYEVPLERIQKRECAKYIGVTSRTLEQRLDEHKRDIRNGDLNTVLAIEAYGDDVRIRWDKARVIR